MPSAPRIHPTAVVDPVAVVAPDATVGPYVVIDGPAVVGPGCILRPHAQLLGRVTLGANNDVGPGTVLGGAPQHLGYRGEDTAVEIGSGNTFREHCTVHRGMPTATGATGVTRVGDGNYLMTGSHVGHDAVLGSHCILVNGAALGGHSEVGDRAVLSAYSVVHQFTRVGRLAMLSGQTSATKDAPPFWVFRDINIVGGVNVVGMRRAGIPTAEIQAVRAVFRSIYVKRWPISVAVDRAEAEYGEVPAVRELVEFIRTSKRGIPGGHLYRGDSHAEAA